MLSLRSVDTEVLHKSGILESCVAAVLKLKSKYRTEVAEEPFLLKSQVAEILACFLSELDTVNVADLSLGHLSWLRFSTAWELSR